MSDPAPVHVPVMLDEVVRWLDPRPGGVIVDGTLGGGGHTRVGTCQVPISEWKRVRNELIEAIREQTIDQPFSPDSRTEKDTAPLSS